MVRARRGRERTVCRPADIHAARFAWWAGRPTVGQRRPVARGAAGRRRGGAGGRRICGGKPPRRRRDHRGRRVGRAGRWSACRQRRGATGERRHRAHRAVAGREVAAARAGAIAGRPRVSSRCALCRARARGPSAAARRACTAHGRHSSSCPLGARPLFLRAELLRLHRAHGRRRPLWLRRGGPARRARVVDQRHVDVCPPEPGAGTDRQTPGKRRAGSLRGVVRPGGARRRGPQRGPAPGPGPAARRASGRRSRRCLVLGARGSVWRAPPRRHPIHYNWSLPCRWLPRSRSCCSCSRS